MSLTQDDEMIEALAPDRSDQPFGKTVLPRRRWCDGFVPNAHGVQSACDDGAIDAIPIADEVKRSLIPRECFRYLMRDPFCCRICCDVDPDEVSAVSNDDEGIEQIEANGRDDEQIHGRVGAVVVLSIRYTKADAVCLAANHFAYSWPIAGRTCSGVTPAQINFPSASFLVLSSMTTIGLLRIRTASSLSAA